MIDEFAELPHIVIDLFSCFKGSEADVDKLHFIKELWDDYNVVLWDGEGWFSHLKFRLAKQEMEELFEMDYVAILKCKHRRLLRYLKFNKTIILTERDSILSVSGRWAVDCFDASKVRHEFNYWTRRNNEF